MRKSPRQTIIRQRVPVATLRSPKSTMSNIPQYGPDDRYKIALVQPASWGDNINSTLMFGPLKRHWPNLLLDVYTADSYASAFYNNEYINRIIEFPASSKERALHLLHVIPPHLDGRGYDRILIPHPMINGDKWTSIRHGEFGTNIICAWVRALEDLNVDYSVPLETVLRLTPAEVEKVHHFCSQIDMSGRNILMETEGLSGQTHWTGEWTVRVGEYLLNGDTNLFVSRRDHGPDVQHLASKAPGRVHFVGPLSLREVAELFNRCDAFLSVSSGLSNACNTSWCKKTIKWFEVTNSSTVTSATIRSDGKTFWHDNNLDGYLNLLRDNGL